MLSSKDRWLHSMCVQLRHLVANNRGQIILLWAHQTMGTDYHKCSAYCWQYPQEYWCSDPYMSHGVQNSNFMAVKWWLVKSVWVIWRPNSITVLSVHIATDMKPNLIREKSHIQNFHTICYKIIEPVAVWYTFSVISLFQFLRSCCYFVLM
jgi:hypothetical protein